MVTRAYVRSKTAWIAMLSLVLWTGQSLGVAQNLPTVVTVPSNISNPTGAAGSSDRGASEAAHAWTFITSPSQAHSFLFQDVPMVTPMVEGVYLQAMPPKPLFVPAQGTQMQVEPVLVAPPHDGALALTTFGPLAPRNGLSARLDSQPDKPA